MRSFGIVLLKRSAQSSAESLKREGCPAKNAWKPQPPCWKRLCYPDFSVRRNFLFRRFKRNILERNGGIGSLRYRNWNNSKIISLFFKFKQGYDIREKCSRAFAKSVSVKQWGYAMAQYSSEGDYYPNIDTLDASDKTAALPMYKLYDGYKLGKKIVIKS